MALQALPRARIVSVREARAVQLAEVVEGEGEADAVTTLLQTRVGLALLRVVAEAEAA